MRTHYAPPERSSERQLRVELEYLSQHPLVEGLLGASSGLLAVLNEHRQILAVNHSLLKYLGVEDSADVLGLRPGEAIGCTYAPDAPSGCGTGEYCKTCGQAIAIVTCQADGAPIERTCAVVVNRDGQKSDLYLRVQCCPMTLDGRKFLLLFLQDITREQQAAAVERAFFHDVVNHITALVQASEALARRPDRNTSERAQNIFAMSMRLAREVEAQRCLAHPDTFTCQRMLENVTLPQVFRELGAMLADHPAADRRRIIWPSAIPELSLTTDYVLLLRALCNLVVNALEATPADGEIRLTIQKLAGQIELGVWNQQAIPPDIAKRIFQRNYSTKPQPGRGLGTYAAKLFAERFLGGSMAFTTSEAEGTTFRLAVPYPAMGAPGAHSKQAGSL